MSSASDVQNVVFIDFNVPDLQDLLDGLQPGEQAFVLAPSSDGLQQIADILVTNDLTNLASISIVSHGASGEIELGSSLIMDADLASNSAALAAIGAALAPGGTIQLYSCDVAQGPAGQQFINDFSTLAGGATVEASTHIVGSAALGGDWTLDASSSGGAALPGGDPPASGASGVDADRPVPGAGETAGSTAGDGPDVPFTADALAEFQGDLASEPDGQLFFRINQGPDVQLGFINSNGTDRNTVYTGGGFDSMAGSGGIGNETAVAVDPAAGLVFDVGAGNKGSYDAFSVHNLHTGNLITTVEFGPNTGSANTDDVVQALAINRFTDTLYVGDWGSALSSTGVREFTYNPLTGALTPVASNGGFLFTASQVPSYVNANAFYLDTTNNLLYYVNDDSGYDFSPFSATNAVYVVSTTGPTFTATQLTSTGSGAGQFPTADQAGAGTDIGANGNIVGLAVDVADGIVFFESTDNVNTSQNALWWVNTTGANQTAQKVTLPAGVTLNFAGQSNEGGDAAGLSFDPQTAQIYLTNAYENGVQPDLGSIYVLQWNNANKTVSLMTSFDTATLVGQSAGTVNAFDAPSTTTFENLPMLAVTGTATSPIQGAAAVTLASSLTATDIDENHFASATVQITGGTFTDPPSDENSGSDDKLSVNGQITGVISGTNITVSYNSTTEALTLTGYDTIANYTTALDEVEYQAAGLNPTNYHSNTTRTISWIISNGLEGIPAGAQNNATTTITITAVNQPPTLSSVAASANFTQGAGSVTLAPAASVSDPDDLDLASATVAIAGGTFAGDGDVLAAEGKTSGTIVQNGNTITVAYNSSSETLTLSGTDTLADYQAVLDAVTFNSTSQNPTDYGSQAKRLVTWVVMDPSGTANGGSNTNSPIPTTTVSITAVNQPPTLSGVASSDSFTQGAGSVTLSPSVTITDVDDLDLASATVKIIGGTFTGDGDVLAAEGKTSGTIVQNGNTITVAYNSSTETLTLTGADTLADYQAVLDSVSFNSTSLNPTDYGSQPTRLVTWMVMDPSGTLNGGQNTNSPIPTTTVSITAVNQPPTLSSVAASANFTQGAGSVTLAPALSVSDPDDLDLSSATVSITAGTFTGDGDVLAAEGKTSGTIVQNGNTITVAYNSSSETLTLSGTDTLADYQAVLDAVTFNSTSQNPTDYHSDLTRTVTWVVMDPSGTANGGHNASTLSTTTITITPVNQPPSLAGIVASVSFTQNGGSVTLSPSVTVSDVDDLDLASATVKITGGTFTGDGDVLAAEGQTSGTIDGGSITVAYNSSTETLTLTGTDTLAEYQTVLDSVSFNSTSQNPTDYGSQAKRLITWVVMDPSGTANGGQNTNSPIPTTTVSITAVNQPPTLSSVAASANFTQGAGSVTLSPSVTVTDVDDLGLASATVKITGGTFVGDGDVLAATTAGTSIAASYDSNTETLVLSGTDTLAHYQTVVDSVSFNSTSLNPTDYGSQAKRLITWVVMDPSGTANGGQNTNSPIPTTTVSITAVNQPPTLSSVAPTDSFTQGAGSVTLSPNVTVTDVDDLDLASATVKITGGTFTGDGDVLAAEGQTSGTIVQNGNTITVAYNSSSETLTLSGTDTLADYQAVLDSVSFNTTSQNPTDYGSQAKRLITWVVMDPSGTANGGNNTNSPIPTTTVSITAVNNPPTLSGVAASVTFTAGQAAVTLSGNVSVSDLDNLDLASATVSITAGTFAGDGDVLEAEGKTSGTIVQGGGTITVAYNSVSETLTLSGTDTLADYQTALDEVTFNSTSANATNGGADPTRTISWVLNDGSGSNNLSTAQFTTVSILAGPQVTVAASVGFTQDGGAVTLSPSVTVTDPVVLDLASATVQITGADIVNGTFTPFGQATGDVLAAEGQTSGTIDGGSITVAYDSATETLTLTGSDTLAEYQAVLDSVSFNNTSQNPTNYGSDPARTVTWTVNDGRATNNIATATETISITAVNQPPTLSGVPASASFTQGGGTVSLSPNFSAITLTDPDNLDMSGATVSIAGGTFAGDGDVLDTNTTGTAITESYNSSTETLVLSGTDTLADYRAVLSFVTFNSTSLNPTDYGSDPTRTITWQVNDGGISNNLSNVETTTVSITAVNQPPTLSNVATNVPFTEGGAAVTLSGAVSISDPDNLDLASATVAITGGTFAGDGDVLSADTAGTAIAASYNSITETLTLTGSDTLKDYQSVLDTVTFNNTSLNPTDYGSAATRLVTWVLNDAGTSNNLSTAATTTVSITAVHNPPTLTGINNTTFVQDGGAVTLSPGVVVADPDSLTLASATVAITGGTFAGDGDVLSANTAGTAITASYNSTTETLTLAGSDTLADYQAVLASVTFESTSSDPTDSGNDRTRTVTWTANDGAGSNNLGTASETVTIARIPVTAPNMAADAAGATVTMAAATGVLSNASDPDGGSVMVTAVANSTAEAGTIGAPLAGTYGHLTLKADGSYSYAADNAAAIAAAPAGAHPLDTFTYTVTDSEGASAANTLTIQIYRAPTASVAIPVLQGTGKTFNLYDYGLGVSDIDGDNGMETATLAVGAGALTVTPGGSGALVTGSGTSSVTISGTLAQINALLQSDASSTVSYFNSLTPQAPAVSTLLTLSVTVGPQTASSTATITLSLTAPPPGGTTSDMIMERSFDGTYQIYDIGKNAILAAYQLGQIGTQWQVAGLGGFNGTDTSDMILRNSNTGAFELYDISNNAFTSTAPAPLGAVGLEWTVAGFGDFSSEPGETDMLMRNNSTGAFAFYDISDNAITSAGPMAVTYPMGTVASQWAVAGFGDFSGNANETDMLMRATSGPDAGAFEVYDISHNAVTSAVSMGVVGLEWTVAGFGDFSGNAGETDMLLRNSNTGAFEVYDISHNAFTSAASMGAVGLEWTVAGFGDFSGNAGETDMLLRNSGTGAFEVYDISHDTITSATAMGAVGLEWTVAGLAADPPAAASPKASIAALMQAVAGFSSGGAPSVSSPIGPTSNPSAYDVLLPSQPLTATSHV